MRILLLLVNVLLLSQILNAQSSSSGVTQSGLKYTITKDIPGPTAQVGDVSKLHINVLINDSIVFNSKEINNNKPVKQPINESNTIADLMEGFMLMSEGDMASFNVPVSAIFKDGMKRPAFIKDGDEMFWEVEMVELKSAKQLKTDALNRLKKDQEDLIKYAKANNIKTIKTPDGDYVSITKEGKGSAIKRGEIIAVNYTGYLLDGTVFDSNIDPKFKHAQEFEFPLGQGAVITGWDNNLAGFPVGTKLKLLIPSLNAYGDTETPGNEVNPKGIPINSPLLFDVEILGSRDMPSNVVTDEE